MNSKATEAGAAPTATITSHNVTLSKPVSHTAMEYTGIVLIVIRTPSPSAPVGTPLGASPEKTLKAPKCPMAPAPETATGAVHTMTVPIHNTLPSMVPAPTLGPGRGTTNLVPIV